MNKIDNILDRLQHAQQPIIDDTEELTERIMNSLPERGESAAKRQKTPINQASLSSLQMVKHEEARPKVKTRKVKLYGRWVAAASVLLIIMYGIWTNYHTPLSIIEKVQPEIVSKKNVTSYTNKAVKVEKCVEQRIVEKESPPPALTAKVHSPQKQFTTEIKKTYKSESAERTVQVATDKAQSSSVPQPIDTHLHYASNISSKDSTYTSPVLMEEYIRKLAAYNGVKPENPDCNDDSTHANLICEAYVFPDIKEVDVFGRLLLAAIAYDDTMPGYLFNYTHQQFFFTMNDQRLQRRYLWIAERIAGNRILLYSTNAPIGAEVLTECFQKYRNKLTNTIISTTTEL